MAALAIVRAVAGSMRIGVVFPQTELGGDRGAVRSYAEAVTELGYTHIVAYDHVLGADPTVHLGWSGVYDIDTTFHEPFVLFGYLAALTPLELVSGILILPQRQTALVAKQAAEIDLLCDGRLRLGVGLGWNAVEYEALGKELTNRGARIGEQVEILRRLWTQHSVTFEGTYEKVTGAGLAPLPIQRPIPIWFGGRSRRALRRAGRIGDGWLAAIPPGRELNDLLAAFHDGAREAGRDPADLGLEGRISVHPDDLERLPQEAEQWRRLGASHLSLDTMKRGLSSVEEHISALAAAAAVLEPQTA